MLTLLSRHRQLPQLIDSSNENKKKKLALLDLLIEAHLQEKNISITDIIEEANTFMFEGTLREWPPASSDLSPPPRPRHGQYKLGLLSPPPGQPPGLPE